jgi:hypothetical protein
MKKEIQQDQQKQIRDALVDVATKAGVTVRFESLKKFHINKDVGFCVISDQSTLFIDKTISLKEQVTILIDYLKTLNLDGIFLPPNIREMLELR